MQCLIDHTLVVIVKCWHVAAHIAQHTLIGLIGCLDLSLRGEERLVLEHCPVELLATRQRVFISCVECIVCLRSIQVLANVATHIVSLRPRAGSLNLSVEQEHLRGGWPHLIIIGHELSLMSTAVGSTSAPVIDHVIKDVMMAIVGTLSVQSARDTPIAAFVVS